MDNLLKFLAIVLLLVILVPILLPWVIAILCAPFAACAMIGSLA